MIVPPQQQAERSKTGEALADGLFDRLGAFRTHPGLASVNTPSGCDRGHFVENRFGIGP
jgi:hypothetical protein